MNKFESLHNGTEAFKVKIAPISYQEYEEMLAKCNGPKSVFEEEQWKEVDSETSIESQGGDSCLISIAINQTDQTLILGHFLSLNEKTEFNNYLEYLKNLLSKGKEIEVFLFGQDYDEDNRSEMIKIQEETLKSLTDLGIKISDLRGRGDHKLTDVFYDATSKTIYYSLSE